MIYRTKLVFIFILIFTSCTTMIRLMEVDHQKYERRKDLKIKTTCELSPQISYVTESNAITEQVSEFFSNLKRQNISLNFIERVVLLSMIQMKFSPILTSPSSRFMMLINLNGQHKYWDFFSLDPNEQKKQKERPLTYLYALEQLLKSYPSQKTLGQLAELADRYIPNPFKVEKEIARQLNQYSYQLSNDHLLKKIYFHDDDVLMTSELLPNLPILLAVEKYQQMKKFQNSKYIMASHHLIPFQRQLSGAQDDFLQVACNQDLEMYKDSIYDILPAKTKSNNFGITDNEGNSALISAGQSPEYLSSLDNSAFIVAPNNSDYSIFCHIRKKDDSQFNFSIIATKSRDPKQQIFHLFKNKIENINQIEDFDQLLNSARFLFLKQPIRILIESSRMSSKQLKSMMKIDAPIYHSPAIGEFWGHIQLSEKKSGLLLDNRYDGSLYCQKDLKL